MITAGVAEGETELAGVVFTEAVDVPEELDLVVLGELDGCVEEEGVGEGDGEVEVDGVGDGWEMRLNDQISLQSLHEPPVSFDLTFQ